MLNKEEIERYSRHIQLPEFGMEAQLKLKQSKVLVVGSGGLGCPALLYMAAAGVGTIGIVDNDIVEGTNLQRQILFTAEDIGKPKAETAKEKLKKQNPHIHLISYFSLLTSLNALEIIKNYDLVIDGSDNFPTRYLINDACVILNKPFVSASLFKFKGQLSIFNYKDGPTYRCLFPEPPSAEEVPSCSEVGVIGVLPGIIGNMQAAEAIKIITGVGKIWSGKVLLIDILNNTFDYFSIQTIPENKKNIRLIDYEEFCNQEKNAIKQISPLELKNCLNNKEDIEIIDVREPEEYAALNIRGKLIPIDSLANNISEIPTDKKVIVHCHKGSRSVKAIKYLQDNYDFKNLYNLRGGIAAWTSAHE